MKSTPKSAESPQRSPANQALFERAQAAAQDGIMADDLRSTSRLECQACGLQWKGQHRTGCGAIPCPRCESRHTYRYAVMGEGDD